MNRFCRKRKGKRVISHKSKGNGQVCRTAKPEKLKTKKLYLGWKHFKEEEEAYVLVPPLKGGGSRVVELSLSTGKLELMKTCKGLFPRGQVYFWKRGGLAI